MVEENDEKEKAVICVDENDDCVGDDDDDDLAVGALCGKWEADDFDDCVDCDDFDDFDDCDFAAENWRVNDCDIARVWESILLQLL